MGCGMTGHALEGRDSSPCAARQWGVATAPFPVSSGRPNRASTAGR